MKFDIKQLRSIIREEVKSARSKRNLSEAMNRITPEEISAWKNGDWGFVSDPLAPMDAGMAAGDDPYRFLHGEDPHDDEGSMVKSRLYSMKKMAMDVCDLLNQDDQLPGWVQDHISVAHENLQQVHGYLTGKQHSVESGKDSMGMHESKRTLKESHNRVTREEMNAWMRGDWGFVSETADYESGERPDFSHYGYEKCEKCGFDHEYDEKEAEKANCPLLMALPASSGPRPMGLEDLPTMLSLRLGKNPEQR